MNVPTCILNQKPVLCEKAFTANAHRPELLNLAKEHTSVHYGSHMDPLHALVAKNTGTDRTGAIGKPYTLSANLGYVIQDKERIIRPGSWPGALLDIGVYTLNFAAMTFGTDIEDVNSAAARQRPEMTRQENITLFYKDGKMASLQAIFYAQTDRMGVISGDKGHLI